MSLPSLWIWTLWSSPLAKLRDVGIKMSGSFSLFNRYQICKLPVGRQWDVRKAGNLRHKWDRIKSAQHTLNGSFPSPLMRVIASLTAVLKYEKHRKRCSSPIITITVIIIYWQFEGNQKTALIGWYNTVIVTAVTGQNKIENFIYNAMRIQKKILNKSYIQYKFLYIWCTLYTYNIH